MTDFPKELPSANSGGRYRCVVDPDMSMYCEQWQRQKKVARH